jgi:His/Glu/Gln/Arg/opine family amino acid ABC transporter permease subunit
MDNWERFLDTFFNAKVMARYAPDIAWGMVVTIELALLVIVTGLAAGLALALVRSLGWRALNLLIVFTVDLFRALPPLVIIVFIYFGLPALELSPSGFVSSWLSLMLVLTATTLRRSRSAPPRTWSCSSRWWCSAAGSRPGCAGSASPCCRPSSTSTSCARPGRSSWAGSATPCCSPWSWCRSACWAA